MPALVLLGVAAIGLMAAFGSTAAAGENETKWQPAGQAARTGDAPSVTSAGTLRWLPYPGKAPTFDGRVLLVQRIVAADVPTPASTPGWRPSSAAGKSPMSDPFDDGKSLTGASPSATLSDSPVAPSGGGPKPSGEGITPPPPSVFGKPEVTAPPPTTSQGQPFNEADRCLTPKELNVRPIEEVTADISIARSDQQKDLPRDCPLEAATFVPRSWCATTFTWTATGECHKSLYFEDEQLERYGHSCGPILQPFVSAGRFVLTLPILPYMMGVYPPNECHYVLGHYRPGNCAPYLLDPFPISVRGAAWEAGAWTAAVFIL